MSRWIAWITSIGRRGRLPSLRGRAGRPAGRIAERVAARTAALRRHRAVPRSGASIAAVALGVALLVALSGGWGGQREPVRGADTAHTSAAALRNLLRGDDPGPLDDIPHAAAQVRRAPKVEEPVDVELQREPVPLSIAVPELDPGMRAAASISFYYCTTREDVAASGDGGGFCGKMRNGQTPFPGAAACDVAYLGQRFRIEGDPTERTYVCADTGSAVSGQHRDIWFFYAADGWAWAQQTGGRVVIEILPPA